ncbi:MAG: glutathione synthase [Desulfobacterales bacterium]|nr:glutathione synthase [Desulfobacterales bacterium]
MILSFHPCFVADTNLIVAGRDPGKAELAAIQSARAVILPQGCRELLWTMAVENCAHVFPDYRARFTYPGKIGQADLFKKLNAPFPETRLYLDLADFYRQHPPGEETLTLTLPLVFKFNWGGEGQAVFLISSRQDLLHQLATAAKFEKTGLAGFILQAYVPHNNRSLRVVIINHRLVSYWRVQPDRQAFGTSLASGALIDPVSDPALQDLGKAAVQEVCAQTGINLAGLDVIFDPVKSPPEPVLLEINYFFGRTGLGGSEAYYRLLVPEIEAWIKAVLKA